MAVCRDRRKFRQQTLDGNFNLFRIVRIERILIESRHRADNAGQNRHRVGVTRKSVVEQTQVFMKHRVATDGISKIRELSLSWQFTINQEIGDFDEIAILGEFFDRVTTITQNAFFAVKERDSAFG